MNIELHLHTDAYENKGIGDGAQTPVQAIDAAARCGATAVAITDHGTCANWTDFFAYANGGEVDHQTLASKGLNPVKPILGTEAYIAKVENLIRKESLSAEQLELLEEYGEKGDFTKSVNQHLILLAKNYVGFQQISRYVSETNRLIKAKEKPIGNFEMLKAIFDNENVVCSSACIAGVIANPLLFNNRINREVAKLERRIAASEEKLGPEYATAKTKVEAVLAEITSREDEIAELKDKASKKFGKVKQSIKKEKDDAVRAKLLEALDLEMLETERAKDRTTILKTEIKSLKASISEDKKVLNKAKNKLATIDQNQNLIKMLEASKKSEEEMFADALAAANTYKNLFGDNFYVELQYHRIKEEAYVMPILVEVAKACDIKCIITNDVHVDTKENLKVREYVRNCASIKRPWIDPIPGDEELYYKTDDEKREILSEILDADVIEAALQNVEAIAESCNLDKLSMGNHYPEFKDADEKLKELALTGATEVELLDGRKIKISSSTAGVAARYGSEWNDDLQKRFDYEMGVISQMGFSSYFLFIADVIIKCKEARENATDIGPGRGSGAGSIVCYLASITELEPIKYGLLFERFLNPERVSMPDIDTDFSKFARQYAVDYVTKFYGAKAVCGIMTKGKMQARNALTYAPKLLAKERGLDVKAYNEQGAALRKLLGNEINIHLSEIEEEVMSTFASDEVALKIFKIAKGLEGKITSYGQHAAGIISIMDGDIQDFIPCMMAADAEGNDKMVIQADMVVAEASLGFIKFDFLGLKNLNVITACQQMVTKNHGVTIDAYNLPLDDEKVYSDIFANKNTNFVFQFESDGMKKMLAELRPTRFEDLVLAVSVYRPGPMDFIPDIIACKNSGEESPIVKRIPILRETLAETYGFPVYQEQVMKIMTLCAGFSMGHADNVRRFMSKKKQDKLAAEEPAFIEGCVKTNGIAAEDAKWLFDQLMPFAKYGFNKSHAAAYSLVSYITAYLKLHYPAEYLCAAMLEQGDKTLQFLSDCKYYGLEVYPVSVNNSSVNYVPEKDGIRIGLSAIKGLKMDGDKIVANRPEVGYVSLIDFIKKNNDIKISATESCILSGALDDFVRNRETAVAYAKAYSELHEKKNEHLEKIAEAKAADNEKKIAEWTEKLTGLEDQIKALNPRQTFDLSDEKKRNYEALYLGMYLSGSPLDDFDVESSKYTNCDVITPDSKVFTIGIVNDFKEIKTSKGDLMCFFKLLDKDSNLTEVVVFPKKYKEIDSLADGMVIEIKGNYDYKKDSDDEFQILADDIKVMTKSSKELLINTTSLSNLFALLEMLKHCSASSGLNVSVKTVSGLRDVEYHVSEDILKDLDANSYEYIVS